MGKLMAKRSRSDTVQLKVRMKESLRSNIETSARKGGHSLNAEIVRRIESSFESEKQAHEIAAESAGAVYAQFGRPETFQIMTLLAGAIRILEMRAGGNCLSDPVLFKEVKVALNTILRALGPQNGKDFTGVLRAGLKEEQAEHLGKEAATAAIEAWIRRMALVDALVGKGKEEEQSSESTEG